MPPSYFLKKNENGYIIIAALLILALLTVISVSAINMSTTESKISANELFYEKTFYAAEAGLEHVVALLATQYITGNQAILAINGDPNWSFALQGAVDTTFEGGVEQINGKLDNINILVRIWNNNDGGGPVNDTDGLIYARSVAEGPRGAVCRVEMLIEGELGEGELVSDYTAQEGAGPGKTYVSSDTEAMQDFTETGLVAN